MVKRMKCREVDKILDTYLAELLDEERAAELERHVRVCPLCSRLVFDFRAALAALDETPERTDSTLLQPELSKVRVEIGRQKRKARVIRIKRFAPYTWSVAAALFIALLCPPLFHGGRTTADWSIQWQVHGHLLSNKYEKPVCLDDRVFALRAAKGQTMVIALDARTGSTLWNTKLDGVRSLAVANRRVYVGCVRDNAFHLSTIQHVNGRSREVLRQPIAQPQIHHVKLQEVAGLLVWRIGGELTCFDPFADRFCWHTRLPGVGGAISDPVDNGEGHLILADKSHLHALDIQTGLLRWSLPHQQNLTRMSQPKLAVEHSRLYLAARLGVGRGALACFRAADGQLLWDERIHEPYQVQVRRDLLLVRGEQLAAYAPETGGMRWSVDIEGCDSAAFHGDAILVLDSGANGALLKLNARNGQRMAALNMPAPSCSGVQIQGDQGFLQTNDGTLYAMKL